MRRSAAVFRLRFTRFGASLALAALDVTFAGSRLSKKNVLDALAGLSNARESSTFTLINAALV